MITCSPYTTHWAHAFLIARPTPPTYFPLRCVVRLHRNVLRSGWRSSGVSYFKYLREKGSQSVSLGLLTSLYCSRTQCPGG